MIGLSLLFYVASMGAAFEVHAVALPPNNVPGRLPAAVMAIHADNDAVADVLVLDGYRLTAHRANSSQGVLWTRTLAPATTAFDVSDVDLDGYPDLIAIERSAVRRYDLRAEGRGQEPVTLFEQSNHLANGATQPFPYVLITERNGQILIALPVDSALELRSLDGALVEQFPIDDPVAQGTSFGPPFSAWSQHPPQMGRRGDLEFRVRHSLEADANVLAELGPSAARNVSGRRGSLGQARDAADLDTVHWLWFPLTKETAGAPRALYALAGPGYTSTQIRIRTVTKAEATPLGAFHQMPDAIQVSTPRLFPGIVVTQPETYPDFNGDGFTDLLLWKAKRPGTSLDTLARAIAGGAWPVRLTVHLFNPENMRYRGRAASQIPLDLSLAWLLEPEAGAPLRHLVLRDFNDDGFTDLGCATTENAYAVWLYEEGFGNTPDYEQDFGEPIDRIAFAEDFQGDGRISLGIRCKKTLYLLHPTKPEPKDTERDVVE
jgi:hypothetical protein